MLQIYQQTALLEHLPIVTGKQFEKAERAVQVAQQGTLSLNKDVAIAQQTLSVRIQQTQERFLQLFRTISESKTFQNFARRSLDLADSLIAVGDALVPILPAITALGGVKLAQLGLAGLRGARGVFTTGRNIAANAAGPGS